MTRKWCARCDELKSAGCFYTDSRNSDGLHSYCKSCVRAYNCQHSAKCRTAGTYGRVTRAQNAVRRANIEPQNCEICRASWEESVAHHQDYGKPLSVNWLCYSCHRRVHNAAVKLRSIAV